MKLSSHMCKPESLSEHFSQRFCQLCSRSLWAGIFQAVAGLTPLQAKFFGSTDCQMFINTQSCSMKQQKRASGVETERGAQQQSPRGLHRRRHSSEALLMQLSIRLATRSAHRGESRHNHNATQQAKSSPATEQKVPISMST